MARGEQEQTETREQQFIRLQAELHDKRQRKEIQAVTDAT
jgi:hypothetical protein